MAKPTKKPVGELSSKLESDDFTAELITSINKEHGAKIAFNLAVDEAPTNVKRWISTGSRLLDYIISNRREGGVPEGRIIEIFGPPSTGKSHIALQICRTTQQLGGIVVYIDTENATMLDKLCEMGLDVQKRFVYIETSCTEEVFSVMESVIAKAKIASKDVPITIVWDSVAATSPKQELLGDYDQNTIGLQARVISKAMRKITGVLGQNNVTLLCLNQTRQAIGIMFGDPTCTDVYTTRINIKSSTGVCQELTMQQFAERFLQVYDFTTPAVYDTSHLDVEILSHDGTSEVYRPLMNFVVKQPVSAHYQLGELKGTAEHRVLLDSKWVELQSHPLAVRVEQDMKVVDVSVDETECYIANGQINHNTTSGGMAIRFHSSVRIQLNGGGKLEDKNGDVIGIKVSAKTVKNKVARPQRKVDFEIHFGKGIVEHEQILELMREEGIQTVGTQTIKVSGDGAWKLLEVRDEKTKELILEKKFSKSTFAGMWTDPTYQKYLEDLLEKLMSSGAADFQTDHDEGEEGDE